MSGTDRDPGTDERARLEALVQGRVQGVGFRYFVLREGHRLGLDGWVANEPDGSVRVVADGSRATLEVLLEALREGPPASIVERVVVNWPPVAARDWHSGAGFTIRSGAHSGD
jgi:acylphosphatase